MSNQDRSGGCTPDSPPRPTPVTAERAATLSVLFKALGDPARLRLLSLIAAQSGGEACVCDISASFDLTQPTISHHLKVLREAGLLTSERRGTWVYYRAVPAAVERMAAALDAVAPLAEAPA